MNKADEISDFLERSKLHYVRHCACLQRKLTHRDRCMYDSGKHRTHVWKDKCYFLFTVIRSELVCYFLSQPLIAGNF